MADMTWKSLFLCSLLLSASLLAVRGEEVTDDEEDYSEPERAFLIVRKHIKDTNVVQGRNFTVFVDVHNAGTHTAKDVRIVDADLPAGLVLTEGSLTISIPKVDVGETISHSYVVTAAQGATGYPLGVAQVVYVSEIDSTDTQAATSSSTGLYVMTPAEQIQYYAIDAGRYLTLGMAKSPSDWFYLTLAVVVVGTLVGGNSAIKQIKQSRKTVAHKKALASLEKEQ